MLTVLPAYPLLWAFGLMPHLDALLEFLGDQCLLLLCGGSPAATAARLRHSLRSTLAVLATCDLLVAHAPLQLTASATCVGAFLLSRGTKGKRLALPSARIMIHQPLGGAQGQAVDIEIQAKEILYLKDTLNGLMAEHTGQPLEKIAEDTDRDYFLSPAEAVQYGLIDRVVTDDAPV